MFWRARRKGGAIPHIEGHSPKKFCRIIGFCLKILPTGAAFVVLFWIMFRLLMVIAVVLGLAVSAFPQTAPEGAGLVAGHTCPTLSVTGPGGIVQPGKLLRFDFSIEPKRPSKDLTFAWTVSEGTIIGGNDREFLEVRPEHYFNQTLTATVAVIGLPDGCPFTASDFFHVSCDPYLAISSDVSFWTQYYDLEWDEEKARLDAAVTDGLKRFPGRTVYIETTFDHKLSQTQLESRNRRITDHLLIKLAANRSFVRTLRGNRTFTNIYLVPGDAPVLDPGYKEYCLQ